MAQKPSANALLCSTMLGQPTGVKGLCEGACAFQRHAPPGGTESQDAAEAGWHSYAASCVAPHGKIHRATGHSNLQPK